MNPLDDNPIPALGDALAELHEVRVAWLFGSQALGTARRDSDVDVAVLVDEDAVVDGDARRATIWRLAGRLGHEVGSHRLDRPAQRCAAAPATARGARRSTVD